MQNRKSSGQRHDALAKKAGEFQIGDDLRVARLGFGAIRITGDGIWGEPSDRAEAVRVLRRAVELGIKFIDTADSYGPDVSEEIIAEALHPYPEGLVIATKGGYMRPGPNQWVENGKPEHLRSACEGSLRRLRLDQIDLYQLHRIDSKVPPGSKSPVSRIAARWRVAPSQLALAWLLARSPVILPIPGTSSVEHLEENVAAAELKIDADKWQELDRLARAS